MHKLEINPLFPDAYYSEHQNKLASFQKKLLEDNWW